MGNVYILGDRDRCDTYKIGATRGSVEKRIKSLQTGNSGEIFEVAHYETEYPFILEGLLHRIYNSSNILNEWFELDNEEINNFIKNCEKMETQIKSLKENHFYGKKITE